MNSLDQGQIIKFKVKRSNLLDQCQGQGHKLLSKVGDGSDLKDAFLLLLGCRTYSHIITPKHKHKLTIQAKTNVNWPKEAFYSKSNGVLSKYDQKNANAHWIKTA